MGKSLSKSDLSSNRRKKRSRKTTLLVFAVVLFLGGLGASVRAEIFRIKDVVVGGVTGEVQARIGEIAKENLVGNKLFVLPKNGALFYPKEQIASSIAGAFPELESVKLKAGIDGTLYIEAKEKTEEFVWCSALNVCYSMDSTGFIFENSNLTLDSIQGTVFRGLIVGEPIGKTFGSEGAGFAGSLASFAGKLGLLGLNVKEVRVVDSTYAEAEVSQGFIIKFDPREVSLGTNTETLFENLKIFITDLKAKNSGSIPELIYIDARYGNKIFYK